MSCQETSEAGPSNRKKVGSHPIFQYFTKDASLYSKTGEVKCNLCFAKLKAQYGNTTTLRRHLERKHYNKFLKLAETEKEIKATKARLNESRSESTVNPTKQQSTLKEFVENKEPYGPSHPKQVAINKALAKWVAQSLHPFTFVEQEGLKEVLKIADPRISVPSADTFQRRLIPEIHNTTVDKIKSIIEAEKPTLHSLSVTTDMWTSTTTQSYLGVTIQFVSQDFSLRSWCIGCHNVKESHSGLVISKELMEILRSWELTEQNIPGLSIYCVTDNAANMKNALAQTDLVHLTCFAHTLNLVIKDTKKDLSGFESLLSKCRALVGHFRHSSTAKANLQNRLKQMGLEPLELIQDVDTRWNSEYLMMQRLLEVKDGLVLELMQPSCKKLDSLSSSEWGLVASYVEILLPVYEATLAVSSGTKPTRSLIIPLIYCIEKHMNKVVMEKQGGIMLARALVKALKCRFPMYMEAQPDQICMFLDPRFKDHILPPHLKVSSKGKIKAEITEIVADKRERPSTSSTSTMTKTIPIRTKEAQSSLFSEFFETSVENKLEKDMSFQGDLEIESYLNETRIDAKTGDPFLWWQTHGSRYKLLSRAARKYLGIPASEVASERVFSTAGGIVTKTRSRLSGENVEKLVFLHENLNKVDF